MARRFASAGVAVLALWFDSQFRIDDALELEHLPFQQSASDADAQGCRRCRD